jgi:hypothetical protein
LNHPASSLKFGRERREVILKTTKVATIGRNLKSLSLETLF